MHGLLIVDKPAGPTSHDVVAVARRAIGIDRIGHTGTLDPLATGVLPLVVGRATRLASFLSGAEKEYVARIRFGTSTATYDAEVEALELAPLPGPVAESAVRDVLPDFAGTYWQLPPPFSAKKIGGTPAYKLARLRKPVELKPVQVTVKAIDLRAFADNLAEIRIVCSSGFYVRSLAHELGQRLECGAYLEGLQRTRAGSFGVADATPLDVLIGEGRAAIERLIPVDRLLPELPAITLSEQGVKRASHGNSLGAQDLLDARKATEWLADGRSGGRLRLVDAAGALLGIAEPLEGGLLHPVIVLV
jgi:tRNA pseudouridine55 synthase